MPDATTAATPLPESADRRVKVPPVDPDLVDFVLAQFPEVLMPEAGLDPQRLAYAHGRRAVALFLRDVCEAQRRRAARA